MNKRDALKLGLQLVETAEYLATDSAICGNYVKEERALIQQSKIAFEEALAQSDQEPDDLTIAYMAGFHAGKNTPHPKPKQEPVAWNVVDPTGKIVATEMNSVRGWARIEGYKKTVEGLLGFHEQGWRVVPTTPPQREWVGLTDEEKHDCYLRIDIWSRCYEMIEAKLREKNSC